MDWFARITSFDVVILFIFLFFIVRGIWVGFFRQVAFFVALFAGYIVAGQFREDFYQLILPFVSNPAVAFLVTYCCLLLAIYFVSHFLGMGLQKVITITMMQWFDRTVGAVLGFLKGFFLANLLFMILAAFLSSNNSFLRDSLAYPLLSATSELVLLMVKDGEIREQFLPQMPAIFEHQAPVPEKMEKQGAKAPVERI